MNANLCIRRCKEMCVLPVLLFIRCLSITIQAHKSDICDTECHLSIQRVAYISIVPNIRNHHKYYKYGRI